MTLCRILFFIVVLGLNSVVQAEWGIAVGSGSYMGEYSVGAHFRSENQKHLFTLGVGRTSGILGKDVEQLNLQYLFSPFEYFYEENRWNIISAGILVAHCLCEESFVRSPSQYPESDYYDNTAYRFGLVFESSVSLRNWTLYWNWTVLDQLAIILANNDRYWDKTHFYLASGVGLRYFF